jgi:hypothetical protein
MGAVRLVFAGTWLLVGGWLLARGGDPVPGLLATTFAMWNLARWRQGRRPMLRQVKRPRPPGGEYHPEFDLGQPRRGG